MGVDLLRQIDSMGDHVAGLMDPVTHDEVIARAEAPPVHVPAPAKRRRLVPVAGLGVATVAIVVVMVVGGSIEPVAVGFSEISDVIGDDRGSPTTAAVTTTAAATTTAAPSATFAPSTTVAFAGEYFSTSARTSDSAVPVYGGTDIPNDEPYDSTFFDNYGVNPRIDTEDDRLSTFAVDVDTGSYTIGRRFLHDGNLPDKDSVRVEEYVNFFDQGYEAPTDEPFAIHIDGGPTPFVENDRYVMLRVGLQSQVIPDEERLPASLTFVIDVSGSMGREDRLETVKAALTMLVEELRPTDTVAIVVYGSRGKVKLEPTPVAKSNKILKVINKLAPEGSTNAAEGLELAYDLARESYVPGAINRVILASDGVANVGNTGPDSILAQIEQEASDGIQLVTVGFGMGNYNDVLMEQLANKGDGFYAYVDDLRQAERLFVHELTGTLQTVAIDTKVQVEFNPDTVERYRLIGFENRAVDDDDFRNDDVDAGEIGAGHSVTAIYELKLIKGVDRADGVATVFLRWQDPESREVIEMNREITAGAIAPTYGLTSHSFQLATTVATYAEVLRNSYWTTHVDLDDVADEAGRLANLTDDEDVHEFAQLAAKAARLVD